ncbi:hypothetical protein [Streptomyces lincolnensis]|uniref:hypothetical protein n=1 Tax=Streptomyces lincolnensis TaxID=1915 RepID=UPI0037AC38ED
MRTLIAGRANRWLLRVSGGAFAFWAVVVVGLSARLPGATDCSGSAEGRVTRLWCEGSSVDPVAVVVGIVLALTLAVGSSLIIAAATKPVLAWLAGTSWPLNGRLAGLTARRLRHHQRVYAAAVGRLASAAGHRARDSEAADDVLTLARDARALARRMRYPSPGGPSPHGNRRVAPTRLGNSFAAMTERVETRHGLQLDVCWPLLEISLCQPHLAGLKRESEVVASRVQNLLWAVCTGVVALAFAAGSLFAGDGTVLAVCMLIAAVAAGATALLHRGLGDAVDDYCDSIEAVLVASRTALYETAGWPQPTDITAERATGRLLTAYLSRRAEQATALTFTPQTYPVDIGQIALDAGQAPASTSAGPTT